MEFCTLAQSLNPWSLSISMNLINSLTPLFLRLGHRLAIFRELTFNYRREIFLRKNLQFQNVAMLTGIMGKVWQKEEITIAMIQLQLWSRDIIIIQIQISHEESLQVSLSLNAITHR